MPHLPDRLLKKKFLSNALHAVKPSWQTKLLWQVGVGPNSKSPVVDSAIICALPKRTIFAAVSILETEYPPLGTIQYPPSILPPPLVPDS